MRDYGNPAFLLNPFNQRFAAARHDNVDIVRHRQHFADSDPVRSGNKLDRAFVQIRSPQPSLQAFEDGARRVEALGTAS